MAQEVMGTSLLQLAGTSRLLQFLLTRFVKFCNMYV